MSFSRLLNQLFGYTRIILILGLIVLAGVGSQLSTVNVYAGTVDNKCATSLPTPVNGQTICEVTYDNQTGGKFNTKFVYIENPTTKKQEFVQLKDCYLAGDKGSTDKGNNCGGFAIVGLNPGDDIEGVKKVTDGFFGDEQGNFKILNPNAVGDDPKNFVGNKCQSKESLDINHELYTCQDYLGASIIVIQNINTGKSSIIKKSGEDGDIKTGETATKARENFKNGLVVGKDGKLVSINTLGGLAPSQYGKLTPDQIRTVNDQMGDNQDIIKKGEPVVITCEVPKLDAQGNVSSVCKGGDGKYYNKDKSGKFGVLKDKCIGITRDEQRNIKDECFTEEKNKTVATLPQNATLQPIDKAIADEKAATAGVTESKGNSAVDLIKSLGAIVGWVLFFLIYFAGWIFSFVLFMISVLFVEILSINPAAPAFIGAAVRPWQVLVGLANLMVLGTFIAIGLGYILNYKPLKRNIREFILQIAVFALLLNFSLLGTGVVVNLASGIGDAMVYSYAGSVKSTGRPNYSRLIGGFVKAINNISAVRCGKSVESTTKRAEFCDVNVDSVPFETDEKNGVANITDSLSNVGQFLGDTSKISGENFLVNAGAQSMLLQYLLFESIFVLVMFYAIIQMFQAFGLVIFRLVGLWMLMVTSPVALALYLAPAKSLNKYATEWLDKFWKATFFYPFFILALVLHTKLVSAIAVALNVGQSLAQSPDTNNASPISMAVIVAAGTLAGVSIVGLALVIKWFKDSFGAIVEAAMKGLGKAFGALKTGSYLAGTALKFGGGATAGLTSQIDKRFFGGKGAEIMDGLASKGSELTARGGFLNKLGGGALKGLSQASLANAIGGAGNLFNFLPNTVDTGTLLAKNSWAGIKKMNQAKIAGQTQGKLGAIESAMRQIGMGGLADNIEGLQTLQGYDAATMAAKKGEMGTLLRDAKEDARTKVLGDKYKNATTARNALEVLMKQVKDKGIDSLSSDQRGRLQQLMKRGVDDTAMSSMLFGTESGRLLSQSMYTSLDSETQRKIQEKQLGGLRDSDAETRAANLSEFEIKNLSNDSYKSKAVQAGLRRNANISDVDLDSRIRSANISDFTNLEDEMGLTAGSENSPFRDQASQDAYNQGRAVNMKPMSAATMQAYSGSVGAIRNELSNGVKLDSDGIAKIIETNLTESLNRDLGSVTDTSGNVTGIGNLKPGVNLQAEVTKIYKEIPSDQLKNLPQAGDIARAIPNFEKLSSVQQDDILRQSMVVNAMSQVNARASTEESLKINAAIQAKATLKADSGAVVPRYSEAVVDSYIGKNATTEDLKADSNFQQMLAATGVANAAATVVSNKSGSFAGITDGTGKELDMQSVLNRARGKQAPDILEAYEKAVKHKVDTGSDDEFDKVVTAIKAVDPTIVTKVDSAKLDQAFQDQSKSEMDRFTSRANSSGSNVDIELDNLKNRYASTVEKQAAKIYAAETAKIDPKLAAEYVTGEFTETPKIRPFSDPNTPNLPPNYTFAPQVEIPKPTPPPRTSQNQQANMNQSPRQYTDPASPGYKRPPNSPDFTPPTP